MALKISRVGGQDGLGTLQVGRRRFTFGEVARGTNITRPHISRLFGGTRTPRVNTARKVASYLGVSVDELLNYLESVK